jgi:lysophospholipase L1-like esterase
MRWSTRVVASLCLVLLGVVVALAIVEAALRVFPPKRTAEYLRSIHLVRRDRAWLFGLRPGASVRLPPAGAIEYAVNADGFRDRQYARHKPAGTFRIVVLGDSIAFGHRVNLEEIFAKVLEQRLAAAVPPPAFEVLDLGVSGYNPYNEAAVFADVGVGYEPDLVLVQFCVNDLNDPTLHFDAGTLSQVGVIPAAAFPDPVHRRLGTRLPTLALRSCRLLRSCELVQDAFPLLFVPDAEAVRAAYEPRDDPSAVELAWLRDRYGEIARTAASVQARFAVVVFPHKRQLQEEASSLLQTRLVTLGREAGWPTIDLLPAFRRAARGSPEPLFMDQWHPTPAGHRVAAEEILSQLRSLDLVPAAR